MTEADKDIQKVFKNVPQRCKPIGRDGGGGGVRGVHSSKQDRVVEEKEERCNNLSTFPLDIQL